MYLAVHTLDTLMMMQPIKKAVQMMPTNLILFSKFLITIPYFLLFFCNCIYSLYNIGIISSRSSSTKFS